MEELGNHQISIYGYLLPPTSPHQIRWYLTVHEDAEGVVDRYPKFLPENVEEVSA